MYRTKEELKRETEIDVFNSYSKLLLDAEIISSEDNKKLKAEVTSECREALKQAIETKSPKKETALDHLYSTVDISSEELFKLPAKFSGKDDIPMAGAINSVLKSELKKNPLLRIWGQDVADFSELEKLDNKQLKGKGGVFKITSGVQRNNPNGQVFNSPLAEANIVGRAIGQAYRGIKPVVEIQFFDYIWTAFMQLKNEMATSRYRSAGDYPCPMVI